MAEREANPSSLDGELTDLSDFERFKERMTKRNSNEISSVSGKYVPRRRSSLMIEYFRDNYMGIEVRHDSSLTVLVY